MWYMTWVETNRVPDGLIRLGIRANLELGLDEGIKPAWMNGKPSGKRCWLGSGKARLRLTPTRRTGSITKCQPSSFNSC